MADLEYAAEKFDAANDWVTDVDMGERERLLGAFIHSGIVRVYPAGHPPTALDRHAIPPPLVTRIDSLHETLTRLDELDEPIEVDTNIVAALISGLSDAAVTACLAEIRDLASELSDAYRAIYGD